MHDNAITTSVMYAKLFLHLHSTEPKSDIVIVRLETGELLIQIAVTSKIIHGNKKEKNRVDLPSSCVAVFPSAINSQLAIKQTFALASTLNRRIEIITSMFE